MFASPRRTARPRFGLDGFAALWLLMVIILSELYLQVPNLIEKNGTKYAGGSSLQSFLLGRLSLPL